MSGKRLSITAIALVLTCCLVTPRTAAAHEINESPDTSVREDLQAADACAIARAFAADLERIRFAMGRPEVGTPLYEVSNATSHHLIDIACVLFERTNRRGVEFGLASINHPSAESDEVSMARLYSLLAAAHEHLRAIGRRLGIEQAPPVAPTSHAEDEDELLELMLQCNRQLNLVMDTPFMPDAVYDRVSTAIESVRIMSGSKPGLSYPEQVPFVAGRRPTDVFNRLKRTVSRVRQLTDAIGIETINIGFSVRTAVTPGDVHDLVVLLQSDLTVLQQYVAPETGSRQSITFPGAQFPSHVYQRVGTLNSFLDDLATRPSFAIQTNEGADQ